VGYIIPEIDVLELLRKCQDIEAVSDDSVD
jgi:hypothetical protein